MNQHTTNRWAWPVHDVPSWLLPHKNRWIMCGAWLYSFGRSLEHMRLGVWPHGAAHLALSILLMLVMCDRFDDHRRAAAVARLTPPRNTSAARTESSE